MAQAYQAGFAKIYAMRWGAFSRQVAPPLKAFIETIFPEPEKHTLLDLCCGAGFLALHFLQAGYHVTGLDLSPAMLQYALENTRDFVDQGQAEFIVADAADFSLADPVWVVLSTFDALNHLPSFAALQSCFRCVQSALHPGGLFIFDLNTASGIRKSWNSISVEDSPELTIINRSVYDESSGKAYTRISGYLRVVEGVYERFEETIYNTVFELAQVQEALKSAGFVGITIAQINDLSTPLEDPESEKRVFFIARKSDHV